MKHIIISKFNGESLYSYVDDVFPPDLADFNGLGRFLFEDTEIFSMTAEGGLFDYKNPSKSVLLNVSSNVLGMNHSSTFELNYLKDNVSSDDIFNDIALFHSSFDFPYSAKKIKIVKESVK